MNFLRLSLVFHMCTTSGVFVQRAIVAILNVYNTQEEEY